MSGDINIDLGSTLAYIEDKVRTAIGYDGASLQVRDLVDKHLRHSVHDAATVQIIGMDRPVSVLEIYQPPVLQYPFRSQSVTFAELLRRRVNTIIFGGPGRGKTTLLHHTFASMGRESKIIPLLFTLRLQEATTDLDNFVKYVASRDWKQGQLLLLVDGLDEISWTGRELVANALRTFASLNIGSYIATCRSFYSVDDIKGQHVEIGPFTRSDAIGFMTAFAKCYGVTINAEQLINDLETHGFSDFVSHPLMLAMICILKSGPMPELPQTPLRLIQRAINTLTLRWDDSKHVVRHSRLQLDGEDRVKCLSHVAYGMPYLAASVTTVEKHISMYLSLLQRTDISVPVLMMELAQWYGILVPSSEHQWTFVHRTIHDYLAAKFWVESGRFDPRTVKTWDSRAAYAACIGPNATDSIVAALQVSRDLGPVVECFYNRALFNAERVAFEIGEFFQRMPSTFDVQRINGIVRLSTHNDFFRYASVSLLEEMTRLSLEERTAARDLLLGYSLSELRRRGQQLPGSLGDRLHSRFPEDGIIDVVRGQECDRVSVAEFRRP
jgi:Predicted NTPase (NACHT family)